MTDHASASQETGRGTRAPTDLGELDARLKLIVSTFRAAVGFEDSAELEEWFRPGFLLDAAKEIETSLSALSALREENERLRTDGELLDWFDRYAVVDACNLTDEDGERRVCILELLDPNLVLARLVNDGGDDGAPIREIIAAARAAAPLRDTKND
jgi:hypothetical protein